MAPAVGIALDQISINGDTNFNAIFTALNNIGSISGAGAEGNSMKQMGPNQVMPALAGTEMLQEQIAGAIGQHEEGLLGWNGGDGMTGRSAGSEYQDGIFWGQMTGGFAQRNAIPSSGGYDQTFYGLTFGADKPLNPNTTLGLAFSWQRSNATGNGGLSGTSVGINSFQLTGYGIKRYGPAFIDGMLGVGGNLFSQSRQIAFMNETAHADFTGMQYMGKAETGWDFPVNTFILTPLTGFEVTRSETDGYTESGAGAADLTVGHMGTNALTSMLGSKLTTTLPTQWGPLIPEAKLFWTHDILNGQISTPAQLDGVSFSTTTPRASADGAQITFAATLKQSNDIAFRLQYTGDLRSDYQPHTALVKMDWSY